MREVWHVVADGLLGLFLRAYFWVRLLTTESLLITKTFVIPFVFFVFPNESLSRFFKRKVWQNE